MQGFLATITTYLSEQTDHMQSMDYRIYYVKKFVISVNYIFNGCFDVKYEMTQLWGTCLFTFYSSPSSSKKLLECECFPH